MSEADIGLVMTCGSGCKYFHTMPNKATCCVRYPPTATIMLLPMEATVVRPGGPTHGIREMASYPQVLPTSPACGEFTLKVGRRVNGG